MRRQFMAIGLGAFALLLFALISATLAAPASRPTLDTEPDNDDFSGADVVVVPGYAVGTVSETDMLDHYVMTTEIGRQYEATLSIINSTGGMKMLMNLYDASQDSLGTDADTLEWTAYTTTHYIRISALLATTTTFQAGDYRLDIARLAMAPTYTPSSTPTRTPTPTPPTGDSYEPNDSFSTAADMPVNMPATLSLTFHTDNDEDWFEFQAKNDKWYQVTTSDLSNVDTRLVIRNNNNEHVTDNDDYTSGYASQVEWEATYDDAYYIHVENKGGSVGTYDLTLEEISAPATDTPEPTNTPVPGATAIPGADQFEPNQDFDHAATLATDVTYSVNFIPYGGGEIDNDYYKIWIKPGLHFTCFTSDLAAGVDPNIIVYDGNRNGIGGNDDIALGNYNSSFSYFSTYEGWLYILVGHGGRLPEGEVADSSYKIRCDKESPGATNTPTPTPTPHPAATQSPYQSPVPTPIPSGELTVRPLTTPTPVPVGTPASRYLPISLRVYYDANNDDQVGAGEGIAGISAQAYEATTNELLAQGFTDEQGVWELSVSVQGPVRVSVPFFSFSQLVAGEEANIYLRIPPQPLPGETP